MKDWRIILAAIVIFVLAVFGIYSLYQRKVSGPSPKPLPEAQQPPSSPAAGFDSEPTVEGISDDQIPASQPDTGTGGTDQSNGIVIISPVANQLVSSPLKVSGWTKIESGNIVIQIKDLNGNVLAQKEQTTCSSNQVCSFSTTISFPKAQTKTGTVEISDGSFVSSSVVQLK